MREMKPVVKVRRLGEFSEERENLEYWLSRPPDERVAAVDLLRAQFHGGARPLQKVVRVLRRPQD